MVTGMVQVVEAPSWKNIEAAEEAEEALPGQVQWHGLLRHHRAKTETEHPTITV
jgi:hypothetical protein